MTMPARLDRIASFLERSAQIMGDRAEAPGVAMFIPTLTGGGAERVLVNLLKIFSDRPRHLVLMERQIAYEFEATLHVLSGDFAARGGPPVRRLRALGENLARVAYLKRRLRDVGVWISFATWANILNVLAGSGRRAILTSHNTESANIRGRLEPVLRRLIRFTYPRAEVVVAVSNSVRRDLIDNFGVPAERVVTIYNPHDIEEVQRLAAELPSPEVSALLSAFPTIVNVGSLKVQKGQWHLLRVFAAVRREHPGARLLILGEGSLGPDLARLARDLGLSTFAYWESPHSTLLSQADVAFAGFTRNPFAVLSRAALFALPSLWEGLPNVLVEALAAGCPTLSTDCRSGPREILAPERPEAPPLDAPEYASAGVLLPTFDGERRGAGTPLTPAEETWARTLGQALSDGTLKARYQAAGRARASAFSIDVIGPVWRALIDGAPRDLAGQRGGGDASMSRRR
jgi:glycosyltransferase involved in cell wall biosynthesis